MLQGTGIMIIHFRPRLVKITQEIDGLVVLYYIFDSGIACDING
jgi:hypothetical protein